QIYPDADSEKAIMGSVVYCIHHKEGCKWTDELRKLKVLAMDTAGATNPGHTEGGKETSSPRRCWPERTSRLKKTCPSLAARIMMGLGI
ncbi:unnamed protein product, partial [Timema podura]|nr:unnamed protein product [Timema podura]